MARNIERKTFRGKRSTGSSEYSKAIQELHGEMRRAGIMDKVLTKAEAIECYKRNGGRCVYCGVSLSVRRDASYDAKLYYTFYVPLKFTKEFTIDNIVPVCNQHKEAYRPLRRDREAIPDVNSIPDLIERLIELKKEETTAPAVKEKIKLIKREMNFQLEQMAASFRYATFRDWEPEEFSVFREEESTIPDRIEDLIVSRLRDGLKQMLWTKEYKVAKK